MSKLKFGAAKASEDPVEVSVAPTTAPSSAKKIAVEKADKSPKFTPNAALITELYGLSLGELTDRAIKAGMPAKQAVDDRHFAVSTAVKTGAIATKVDIRGAIVQFITHSVTADTDGYVPASAIHAFMHLTAGQAYEGKYDTGYPSATKPGSSRGMVARGYLVMKLVAPKA